MATVRIAVASTPLTASLEEAVPAAIVSGGEAAVPDVRGLSARDAMRVLNRAGLTVQLSGSGVVVEQTPAAGTLLGGVRVAALTLRREAPPGGGGGGR